jgi:hypothetical protein
MIYDCRHSASWSPEFDTKSRFSSIFDLVTQSNQRPGSVTVKSAGGAKWLI